MEINLCPCYSQITYLKVNSVFNSLHAGYFYVLLLSSADFFFSKLTFS